ncbi:MAG: 50S ribosomal protein L35 [Dehalococcoidia bacterium]|nr:MAG: 50S ribosomal protein L35 [Dehalococcoidia bacterium]
MPKLKTHKGARSRFNITGTGKIMRMKGGKSHLRRNKSDRSKGLFDEMIPLSPRDRVRIQRLIPNGTG